MVYAIQRIQDTACLLQWRAHSTFYKAITDCKVHRAVEKSSPLWSDRNNFGSLRLKQHRQLLTLRWSQLWTKLHLNWGEKSSIMVQNHDFALPLALRKIVYKPLAVKSIVPTLLRHTCECLPERDLEMWLHWDLLGAWPSSNSLLLFSPLPFTQPYFNSG